MNEETEVDKSYERERKVANSFSLFQASCFVSGATCRLGRGEGELT